MNTRPNIIDGCAYMEVLFGRPNAHRSFSFGTSAAVSPAAAALWKRVFCASTPQPFQAGALCGFLQGRIRRAAVGHLVGVAGARACRGTGR